MEPTSQWRRKRLKVFLCIKFMSSKLPDFWQNLPIQNTTEVSTLTTTIKTWQQTETSQMWSLKQEFTLELPLPVSVTWLSAIYFMEHEIRQCQPVPQSECIASKDLFQSLFIRIGRSAWTWALYTVQYAFLHTQHALYAVRYAISCDEDLIPLPGLTA